MRACVRVCVRASLQLASADRELRFNPSRNPTAQRAPVHISGTVVVPFSFSESPKQLSAYPRIRSPHTPPPPPHTHTRPRPNSLVHPPGRFPSHPAPGRLQPEPAPQCPLNTPPVAAPWRPICRC